MAATPKPGMLTPAELAVYPDRVMAYRNLHFKAAVMYSVKDRRRDRLIAYTAELLLVDVQFVIRESERRRAVLNNERNVHAFAVGTIGVPPEVTASRAAVLAGKPAVPVAWRRGDYLPFKHPTFIDCETEQPILEATAVHLGPAGLHYLP